MTELDQLLKSIYQTGTEQNNINKFYSYFLRTNLYMPIEKTSEDRKIQSSIENSNVAFSPLYAEHNGNFFLAVFDTLEKLHAWASNSLSELSYVSILGRELIKGIHEKSYLCFNLQTDFYKEFAPEELIHLKKIVLKTEKIISANSHTYHS